MVAKSTPHHTHNMVEPQKWKQTFTKEEIELFYLGNWFTVLAQGPTFNTKIEITKYQMQGSSQ
jgi:hypothetical protein